MLGAKDGNSRNGPSPTGEDQATNASPSVAIMGKSRVPFQRAGGLLFPKSLLPASQAQRRFSLRWGSDDGCLQDSCSWCRWSYLQKISTFPISNSLAIAFIVQPSIIRAKARVRWTGVWFDVKYFIVCLLSSNSLLKCIERDFFLCKRVHHRNIR